MVDYAVFKKQTKRSDKQMKQQEVDCGCFAAKGRRAKDLEMSPERQRQVCVNITKFKQCVCHRYLEKQQQQLMSLIFR